METIFLKDALHPRYFISYSRRDLTIVNEVKAQLSPLASNIWHDIDQLVVGDDWMLEIENGIRNTDELILLLSEASAASIVVQQELAFAQSLRKVIRPILVEPILSKLPNAIKQLQCLDLSTLETGRSAAIANCLNLTEEVSAGIGAVQPIHRVKMLCCRTVWPPFDRQMLTGDGQKSLLELAAIIRIILPNYSPSSLIVLNAGLLNCTLGAWDLGLEQLRAYAWAAASFPGWYMYALHLNRGRPVSSIDPHTGQEVLDSISRAERFGENTLCYLLKLNYELGYENMHPLCLPARLSRLRELESAGADLEGEYIRFYWCMRESLPLFREYKSFVANVLKSRGAVNA